MNSLRAFFLQAPTTNQREYRMNLGRLMWIVLVTALLSACIAPVPAAPGGEASLPTAEQVVSEHGEHAMGMPEELGEVNFPITCAAEAQEEFNHGMALLHSFWYPAAIESFTTVTELDPSCAMGYWGVAMSLVEPLWAGPSAQDLVDGWAIVEKANAVGAKTPREQAYIAAITAFYQDSDSLDHRTRSLAYEQLMAQLAQEYPEDTEAQIFYALALLGTAQPSDKTYANQHKAVEILEPIFVVQPNHPGVAHYLIHSNDYPVLAAEGQAAAQRYAGIAPASSHALHMPSHIFTRLGYWQESIDTNIASANAAAAGSSDALHAMDYLMYAYLQLGRDVAAKALLDEISVTEQLDLQGLGGSYALAAMPARYALERGQWAEAAALALYPEDPGWERFPQSEAILVSSRGLGAARGGDVAVARQALERLQELREAMVAAKLDYWATQADIQSKAIEAWVALAEGDDEQALALMREAVAMTDATEKHPVTPGAVAPAHELLGEMLLVLEQPVEALVEFEASHQIEPNRFRGLYGAGRAAELAGDKEQARTYYEQLLQLADQADGERPELATAKAFLAQP